MGIFHSSEYNLRVYEDSDVVKYGTTYIIGKMKIHSKNQNENDSMKHSEFAFRPAIMPFDRRTISLIGISGFAT